MKNQKSSHWTKLDNAAKIFPSTSNKRDTKVFRFSCELYEYIDKDVLQKAMENTVNAFPIYKSVLRSGLFWYYFETSNIEPIVKIEDSPPCSPLYDKNMKNLLFQVTYYKNRINLELYHALSDGTGALQFLRLLVYHYITIKYNDKFKDKLPVMDYDASITQKMDDSFQKYYTSSKKQIKKSTELAYKIKGARIPEHRIQIIEGTMSVGSVLRKAKEHNTSMTIFLVSILMCAINEEMAVRHRKRPVVLSIPVNLRNYFYSESARNFFGVINIKYDFKSNNGEFLDVIDHVKKCFETELTTEKLSTRMNTLSALEHNIFMRAIPLAIKDIILRIAGVISEAEMTGAFSNIGKIDMPTELKPYIKLFDVFISTNKLQVCLCSFEDNLNITFTSPFINTDIQRRFYRFLANMGIDIKIATNSVEEE